MSVSVLAVGRSDVPPIAMPDRFRQEIAYFMAAGSTTAGTAGEKPVVGEYALNLTELRTVLDDGCVMLVSPLDSDTHAEIELAEDHERWLEWVLRHAVERIRFAATG
jgi:hypothetical protein